jgi:4-hydroxy-tetrahydrodipicolinate synthase
LVTPFHRDGSLDEHALRRLVQFQLREGIDFLAPCGATGEEPTLDHAEYLTVVRVVIEEAAGRVPVIPGVCGNDTRKVVRLAEEVRKLGADAILSVAPFYNTPTQEGIYQHFKTLAQASGLPVILYNVPGRTNSNIRAAMVARLSELPNIIGIKEASGNIVQQTEMLLIAAPFFKVFSGYDCFTFPMMCLGAIGSFSVAANEVPRQMVRLVHLLAEGKYANFLETNPIPVKSALAMMGMVEESFRLPLVPMRSETRRELAQVLAAQGLLPANAVGKAGI